MNLLHPIHFYVEVFQIVNSRHIRNSCWPRLLYSPLSSTENICLAEMFQGINNSNPEQRI